VSPVKYELGVYIPEDILFNSHICKVIVGRLSMALCIYLMLCNGFVLWCMYRGVG
jgi:hypothetical protein